MFDFLKFNKKKLQGYKATNVERTKKLGIAANSLNMLIEKSCQKFNMKTCKLFLAKDGNSIDDEEYFQTIEPQTLIIVASEHDVVKSDFEILLETIKSANAELLSAGEVAQNFITKNHEEIAKILNEKIDLYNSKTMKSARCDHPEWFSNSDVGSGGNKSATMLNETKEDFMSRKSRDRIRGYFYKTKDEILKSHIYRTNKKSRELLDNLLFIFNYLLIGTDYFGCLFNRAHKRSIDNKNLVGGGGDQHDGPINKKMRKAIENFVLNDNNNNSKCSNSSSIIKFEPYLIKLCNDRGDFRCQGSWDEESCKHRLHTINPYSSRENCILFQTWNLDHQIELTRSVIPAIIANVTKLSASNDRRDLCKLHNKRLIDTSAIDFFLKIFTIDNLKLVHIVCHDKATHEYLKKFSGKLICMDCEEYKWIKELDDLIKKSGK